MRPIIKHRKDPKCCDHNCLRLFLSLSTLPMMIQAFGKSVLCWPEKVSSIRKLLISKVQSILKSNFDLN